MPYHNKSSTPDFGVNRNLFIVSTVPLEQQGKVKFCTPFSPDSAYHLTMLNVSFLNTIKLFGLESINVPICPCKDHIYINLYNYLNSFPYVHKQCVVSGQSRLPKIRPVLFCFLNFPLSPWSGCKI